MTSFSIRRLRHVVFLGAAPNIKEIVGALVDLDIEYSLITSPSQASSFPEDLSVHVFKKLDDSFISFVKSSYCIEETLFVSLAARWIFKSEIFANLMKNQLVNFHGTRLPIDSGGGGFSWRIMRSDRIDNQLVHLIDSGVDSGDIIYTKTSVFPKHCITPREIEEFHRAQFVRFFHEFCKKVKDGHSFKLRPQQSYLASYMPRLSTLNNGYIDWSNNSDQLIRFIDAFDDFYPGALTLLNGALVHLKNVQRHGGEIAGHPFMRGLVIRNEKDWIVVRTSDEFCLVIENVNNSEGTNIVSKVKVGDRFYTPPEMLSSSLGYRARFGPNTRETY